MTNFISQINNSWTLFLDRDGVINKRIFGGYVSNWDDFEFLPGVLDAFSVFSEIFKNIIIVTNQQGVGKGLMNEDQLQTVHLKLREEVLSNGGRIDAIYYCTKLANENNNCRKPGIKMAEMAKQEFPEIDFEKSVMIGDSVSDIIFGKNAGMKTILHKSEELLAVDADLEFDSLIEFANILKKLHLQY